MLRPILGALGAGVILYFLFFFGMGDVGLLGPDEPRYASIGREMALTGDWVTPRLWGKPWFEKPALLYWMTAAGFAGRLDDDYAPRVPVALMSTLFLVFMFFWLKRQYGGRVAGYSTAMLATSAGWFTFSQLGVTDLPLSATFGAAALLCLPWVLNGNRAVILPAGVCLGLAVLAKGLVPLVLALPTLWFGRRRPADVALLYGFAVLTAAPWYVLCALENGRPFLEEFIWRHHFGRFGSPELQHVQPVWFYLPVLLAGLLPWSPVLFLAARRRLYNDSRAHFLLAVAVFGFLFFSASANKLPGYLLPIFPPLAALAGLALDSAPRAGVALGVSSSTLAVVPVAAAILPASLRRGLGSVEWPPLPAFALGGALAVAILAAWLSRRGRRPLAVSLIASATVAGVAYLKMTAYPVLDREVSARTLWADIAGFSEQVCVEDIHRSWLYGLNYYTLEPLPSCASKDLPLRLRQPPEGGRPYIGRR